MSDLLRHVVQDLRLRSGRGLSRQECVDAAGEIERLHTRLKIPAPPFEAYDGIACRDETIRLLDAQIERLKKERDEAGASREIIAATLSKAEADYAAVLRRTTELEDENARLRHEAVCLSEALSEGGEALVRLTKASTDMLKRSRRRGDLR